VMLCAGWRIWVEVCNSAHMLKVQCLSSVLFHLAAFRLAVRCRLSAVVCRTAVRLRSGMQLQANNVLVACQRASQTAASMIADLWQPCES
jgi:hypothetical protein